MSPLSQDQVRRFHADGFLACEGFLAPERVSELSSWVDDVAAWPEDSGRCVHHRESTEHGPALARTERFLAHHEGFRGLLTSGSIIEAVGQLFAEPASIFKEKINYKHAGGAGFNPHQDAAAYKRFGTLHITCLVAVDLNTTENGCLWFAPGQHLKPLPENDAGCLSTDLTEQWDWVAAPLSPGGVLFFSSLVPHRSYANQTSMSRRSLYVTYGKQSEGNLRDAYYNDRSQVMQDNGAARISTIGHFQGKVIHR